MSRDSLPPDIRLAVEDGLEEATGQPRRIVGTRPVGGGCINPSVRVDLDDGEALFLKWNDHASPGMFEAEADGLRALAGAGTRLRVPEVVAIASTGGDNTSWIVMEFVEQGRGGVGWGAELARGLGALHRPLEEVCGWEHDNFIGSLPQANGPDPDWGRFYRERRILPQLRAARDAGHLRGPGGRSLDELAERIPELLGGRCASGPSLLHGDLWGGNVFPDGAGRPVLVDPAVYRGDPEVDLAMSELFGFPAGFGPAYRDVHPVDEGYARYRRDLYQLYYLLVHVTLFGSGYEEACLRAAERVLSRG